MCVHPTHIGYDELKRDILETKYNYDTIDDCDYIELNKTITKEAEDLMILNLNIRGLYSKLGNLTYLIDNVSKVAPDVITLSETWSSKNTPKFEIPGYKIFRQDRENKKGGGVAILVKNNLQSRILELPKVMDNVEICGVQINTNKGQLGVLSMYRPPNTRATNFKSIFEKVVKLARKNCKDIIIGMDHNLDFLKSHLHEPTNQFVEKILDLGLLPVTTRPTRITKSTATLIDNIVLDCKHREMVESYVAIDNTSDHLPCVAIVKDILVTRNTKIKIKSRDLRDKKIELLKRELETIDWNALVSTSTKNIDKLNNSVGLMHSRLCEEIERCCPLVEREIKYCKLRKEPWVSSGLLTSIRKSKKLYKDTLMAGCDTKLIEKYKLYNSKLQHLKRRAKAKYYFDKCEEFRNNTKKLWQTINRLCGKTNDKTSVISSLMIGKARCYDTAKIANEFGDYFANVGENYARKIPPSQKGINHYLSKLQSSRESIFLKPTNKAEIQRLIALLPNKGSSGYDKIDNILLKKISTQVSEPICLITNLSLETGIFPDLMKNALVVPLYKARNREDVGNYRPISLLLTISKLIEKVVYKQVYQYLTKTGQLQSSQYGFRSSHSCEHAIGELLGNIVKNMQLGKETVTLMLDLSKAFDTLQHEVIFKKLEKYGLRGPCLEWFKSYLTNRSLQTKCMDHQGNEILSDKKHCDFGTPQGSCMGPLLFLIFCNDLHLNLNFLSSIQFADDTTLYISHKNQNYMKFCLVTDLEAIEDWFRANKLTLNLDKTVLMYFGLGRNKPLCGIEVGNIKLKVATSTKFLGIWIDNKLKWREHVQKLILKLQAKKALLQRSKYLLSVQAKKILYHAQIQSNLTYGLLIWGTMIPKEDALKLANIQNKCVQLIEPKKSIDRIYKDNNILKLENLIKVENVKTWHKYYTNTLPVKLMEMMREDHNKASLLKQHGYSTRRKKEINLPLATCHSYKTSFFVEGLKLYSDLPTEMKREKRLNRLVTMYKTHLLSTQ